MQMCGWLAWVCSYVLSYEDAPVGKDGYAPRSFPAQAQPQAASERERRLVPSWLESLNQSYRLARVITYTCILDMRTGLV